MNIRMKYTKTGPLRFISHLDVMRFFQKAIRRAEFDISYTGGFSPHQIISFAAPMPLLMTSEGEYVDAEFESVTTTEDMIERFNAVSTPYIQLKDIVVLPDKAKNSMSVVAASDYVIRSAKEEKTLDVEAFLTAFHENESLVILKKTKKKEEMTDIKPLILKLDKTEDGTGLYMLLAAGSVNNCKPEQVMEGLCSKLSISYDRYDYEMHRLETYMKDESGEKLISLICAGEHF